MSAILFSLEICLLTLALNVRYTAVYFKDREASKSIVFKECSALLNYILILLTINILN